MGKIGAEALRFFTCLAAIVREILPCYYCYDCVLLKHVLATSVKACPESELACAM